MKTISREKYYVLKGLIEIIKIYEDVMKTIETTALVITGEVDDKGNALFGGHTADILWGSRDLDSGLKIMEIDVEKQPRRKLVVIPEEKKEEINETL